MIGDVPGSKSIFFFSPLTGLLWETLVFYFLSLPATHTLSLGSVVPKGQHWSAPSSPPKHFLCWLVSAKTPFAPSQIRNLRLVFECWNENRGVHVTSLFLRLWGQDWNRQKNPEKRYKLVSGVQHQGLLENWQTGGIGQGRILAFLHTPTKHNADSFLIVP